MFVHTWHKFQGSWKLLLQRPLCLARNVTWHGICSFAARKYRKTVSKPSSSCRPQWRRSKTTKFIAEECLSRILTSTISLKPLKKTHNFNSSLTLEPSLIERNEEVLPAKKLFRACHPQNRSLTSIFRIILTNQMTKPPITERKTQLSFQISPFVIGGITVVKIFKTWKLTSNRV